MKVRKSALLKSVVVLALVGCSASAPRLIRSHFDIASQLLVSRNGLTGVLEPAAEDVQALIQKAASTSYYTGLVVGGVMFSLLYFAIEELFGKLPSTTTRRNHEERV